MRKLLFFGLLSVCLAAVTVPAASAAEIHGTFTENGKPVPKGLAVKLDCGGGAPASATTDEFGAYSVKTAAAGDCMLSLDYKNAAPQKVVVYEKPSRYDFEVKAESGKVTLARK